MSETILTIPFVVDSASSTTAKVFVNLQQVDEDETQESVTAYDIQQMVARARSGMSAATYKVSDCPAYIENGTLVAEFDFYAWPSCPCLVYTLTAGLGNITCQRIVQKTVDFSVTFELTDVVEFDFILEELTSYIWETECYDSDGAVVDGVTLEMDGYTTLRASAPIFGVVRLKGIKRGGLHTLTTRLVKTMAVAPTEEEYDDSDAGHYMTYTDFIAMYFPDSDVSVWNGADAPEGLINYTGLKLSNLQVSVTAHWIDGGEEKTESMLIEVPDCIEDLLAVCGEDTNGDGIIDDWSGSEDALLGDEQEFCGERGAPSWNVYISGCTGKELLAVQRDEDKNSWCGK